MTTPEWVPLPTILGIGLVLCCSCQDGDGACDRDGGGCDSGSPFDGGADSGVPSPWQDGGVCVGPGATGAYVFLEFCDSTLDCSYLDQDTYHYDCVFYEPIGASTCLPVSSCETDEDCDADAGRACRIDSYVGAAYKRCVRACDTLEPDGSVCGPGGFRGAMRCLQQSGLGPVVCVAAGCTTDDECGGFSPPWAVATCQMDSDAPSACVTPCSP